MRRNSTRDDAVKAAFDRHHASNAPKPAADRQLRRDPRAAGIRTEFKEGETS